MPAGMETITPDGRVQLTTDMLYFRLEQKIELPADNVGWSQFGAQSTQRDIFVSGLSVADSPMLALASPSYTWAEMVAGAAGGVTWRIYRAGANVVTLYVFSQRRPPVSEHMAGCELFKPDGSIVYSSDYPIARPLGMLSSPAPGSYSGVSLAGRSVAHVPQKQEVTNAIIFTNGSLGSCYYSSNLQGYQVYRRDQWARTGVVAWGSSATGTGNAFNADTGSFQYQCYPSSSSIPPSQQVGSTGGWRSMIIDVTNI